MPSLPSDTAASAMVESLGRFRAPGNRPSTYLWRSWGQCAPQSLSRRTGPVAARPDPRHGFRDLRPRHSGRPGAWATMVKTV
jgi:hypothetical protein